jgi:hypothetical protein
MSSVDARAAVVNRRRGDFAEEPARTPSLGHDGTTWRKAKWIGSCWWRRRSCWHPVWRSVTGASDGALDATFGTGGQVVTDFGGAGAIANAVAIQRDGRIMAAGSSLTADRLASDFALARYEDGDRCPDSDGDDD